MQTQSNRYTPQKPQSQAVSMRPPLLASKPDQVTSPKLVFEDPGDRERPTTKKKVSIFGDDGLKPGNSNSDYNKKADQVEKVLDAINFDFSSGKKERPNLMLSGSKNTPYSQDSRLGFGSSLRNTANSTNPQSMNSFEPQTAAYPNRSGSRLPPQPESEREMPMPRPQSNSHSAPQGMKFQNQIRQPEGLRSPERSLDLGSNGQFQENLGGPMGGPGPQNPNLNIYQQNVGMGRPNHIAQQPQPQMNMMQQRPLQGSYNDSSNGMTQSNPYGLAPAGGMSFPPRPGQFQTPISDSGLGSGPMNPAALSRLDREFQELRAACARKEQELRVLQAIADGQMPSGGPSVQLPSKDTLEKCVQASKQLKRQEAELRDLRFNYTMLKEETERQELELRRARDMDGIDRIPRTQDELIKQNNVLRQKINTINQEYEKTIYDKTLEIEKKARTKMHKIALQIAREQVNPEDQEMRDLIAKATELEREYERLEREHNPNEMSFVGIAN